VEQQIHHARDACIGKLARGLRPRPVAVMIEGETGRFDRARPGLPQPWVT
jgi:hypothetical protein